VIQFVVMKRASAVCIVAAWVVLCGFQQPTSPQGKTDKKPADAAHANTNPAHPQTLAPPPIPANSPDADANGVESHGKQNIQIISAAPEKSVDLVDRAISIIGVICTVALAGVGIYGIVIALRTLKQISEQTASLKVYVEETKKIAKFTEDSMQVNRESLQAGQRPYVGFTFNDPVITCIANTEGTIVGRRFSLPVENTGNTPTIETRIKVNFKENEGIGELPADFSYPDIGAGDESYSLLGAKSRVYSGDLDIAEAVIQRVHQRKSRLFFWGWAVYKDVFENTPEHRTEFCHEARIIHLAGNEIGLTISSYGHHNKQT